MKNRSAEPPFVHYDGSWKGSRSNLRFVHFELLSTRIRKYSWELSPHRHRDLHQFLICRKGRGDVAFDLQQAEFVAPAVVSVPPLVVHKFSLVPQSQGYLLTIVDSYLVDLMRLVPEHGEKDAMRRTLILDMAQEAELWQQINSALRPLNEQVGAELRSSSAVVLANLLVVLEAVLRHPASRRASDMESSGPRTRALYDRFCQLIEAHYMEQWPVSAYVHALGVTERTLHRTSGAIAGAPPLKIIHRRIAIEAQRRLLYSAASVSEIGYSLGFRDPAHFSHFFSENVGESPLAFRRARLG